MVRNKIQQRLTDEQVHTIRMLRGLEPARVTGLKFDRSQPVINQIQAGHAYRHVPWTDEEREHRRKYPNMMPTPLYSWRQRQLRCPHCGKAFNEKPDYERPDDKATLRPFVPVE